VIDDARLVGIITERDLVRAIADGLNPMQASASLVMTSDPATVSLDEDVNVVAVKMMRLGIRHLPVVDEQGRPAGLVSARNLVALLDRA
jgi:CBS domain-containing protein